MKCLAGMLYQFSRHKIIKLPGTSIQKFFHFSPHFVLPGFVCFSFQMKYIQQHENKLFLKTSQTNIKWAKCLCIKKNCSNSSLVCFVQCRSLENPGFEPFVRKTRPLFLRLISAGAKSDIAIAFVLQKDLSILLTKD